MILDIQNEKYILAETEEKIEMVKEIVNGNQNAKNLFYNQYEKMVKKIVFDFFHKKGQGVQNPLLELADYEQEVWRALFENLSKYNPERAKISTYIYLRGTACLLRYQENNSRPMRLPVYKVQLFNKMKKFATEYENSNGFYPDESVLCSEFELTNKELVQFYEYTTMFRSLEQNLGEQDDNSNLHNVLEAKENTEITGMSNILIGEIKDTILKSASLKPEQKTIVDLWLFKETTDKEICQTLNIPKTNLLCEKDKIKKILRKLLFQYKKDLI